MFQLSINNNSDQNFAFYSFFLLNSAIYWVSKKKAGIVYCSYVGNKVVKLDFCWI